jgi:hypothetical protein
MSGNCPSSILNIANCPAGQNNNYNLDSSIKNYLKLDESFKINDSSNIENEINNKINQSNISNCSSSASSANQIILNDIQCDVASASGKSLNPKGKLTITDIEQKAIAKLYMTCIINQSNVSDISTKILNKISSKYNQIYDAVAKKAQETNDPEYYNNATKFLDTLSAAGMEQINAAAGNLPPKTNNISTPVVPPTTGTTTSPVVPPTSETTTPSIVPPISGTTTQPTTTPTSTIQPTTSPTTPPTTSPTTPPSTTPSITPSTASSTTQQNIFPFNINYVLLLFCILIMIGFFIYLIKYFK